MKSIRHLKQVFLYLIAYFMLQESGSRSRVSWDELIPIAYGTYYGVVGILQNE